jgi:hypothetical protein
MLLPTNRQRSPFSDFFPSGRFERAVPAVGGSGGTLAGSSGLH